MRFEYSKIPEYVKTSIYPLFGFFNKCTIKKTRFRGIVRPGNNSVIGNSYVSGHISTGAHCKIMDSTLIGQIEIGRYTSINGPNTDIYTKFNMVKIGSFTSIARNVSFQEYNHKTSRMSTYLIGKNVFGLEMEEDLESKGSIDVGNDVWIGNRVSVLGGVTIGNGAIIASNSLVNCNIPPYAIAGGIPAKIIKYRFSQNIIEKLQQLEWWNWPIEKIKENESLFLKDNLRIEDLEGVLND